ncbi:MAG: hypothetical protein P1U68_10185 [Verrucomicrobiales bacterium]|nr:hypothetical protein [Verrucomicrobiales bacterium]
MSDLPEEYFKPVSGKLGQLIYENPADGVGPRLQFFVEIAFAPFEIDDESVSPILRVDNIVVEAGSWKSLQDRVVDFPYAPKPGSVEGAVLLFGEHNPADVTKMNFGKVEDGKVIVSFETEVDFEIEADRDDLEQVEMSFDLALAVEPLRISTSLEKRCQGDEAAISAEVGKLVDLESYGEIEKAPGGFIYPVS